MIKIFKGDDVDDLIREANIWLGEKSKATSVNLLILDKDGKIWLTITYENV